MRKAVLVPVLFREANERERGESAGQIAVLREMYGRQAEFSEPVLLGDSMPECDAVLFPQLIGAAFRHKREIRELRKDIVVLTSSFGTVEMWDWEIVSFLRDQGVTVFTPYSRALAETVLRAMGIRRELKNGAKFLMFQDDPGEGMQAYIFKRFYWWEKECTEKMRDAFGLNIVYKSWIGVNNQARSIPDEDARRESADWDLPMQGVSEPDFLKAVKLYMAIKSEIAKEGNVVGAGSNCLNESMHSDTTPCLAWNMLFERDDIIWACEGDTVTLISTYLVYRSLESPVMMSNIYPFLMGMAALKHEKIDKFPEIEDPDNHALFVHCGYFGFVPRPFCSEWCLRPKVLEIVNDNALMVDCRMPEGPATITKLHSNMKKLIIIEAEIEKYVQYPGSDCRNGALIRVNDGHRLMETLSSHHALLLTGRQKTGLLQLARVFGWETEVL